MAKIMQRFGEKGLVVLLLFLLLAVQILQLLSRTVWCLFFLARILLFPPTVCFALCPSRISLFLYFSISLFLSNCSFLFIFVVQ